MGMNFPNTPAEGQVFLPPGGPAYVWHSPAWEAQAPAQTASRLTVVDGTAAPAAVAGQASIYVDSADGDLKVKFGDGVVKTIVVDT